MTTRMQEHGVSPEADPGRHGTHVPVGGLGKAIDARDLTKTFGEFKAVDQLSFEVDTGKVVGLLGPNGAGKSTTIRMLLGLIRSTSGTAVVVGKEISNPSSYLGSVGALIESPAFYPKLSGRANLRTLATLQSVPQSRIEEVLDLVGLSARGDERVSDYSLGMKQRLAIAAALLRDPDVLILDEPTNGLDPAGIVEMRSLLRRLAADGKTVFVSSHLLAEVQAMVSDVVIINRGKLVFQGNLAALLDEASHEVVVVPDLAEDKQRLTEVLSDAGYTAVVDQDAVRVANAVSEPANLNRIAFDSGIVLRELRVHDEDLEDVFLRLTGGEMGL